MMKFICHAGRTQYTVIDRQTHTITRSQGVARIADHTAL